jgi:hypothetical protein
MSDTEEYVQPPINVGFTTPMVLTNEPPKDEPTPIESSPEALHEAAKELVDNGPEADVITFRDVQTGGPKPASETLSAEDAAKELASYRIANEDVREAQSDQATRELIDHIQGNAANPDLQPQAQQPEPQQPEAQPVQIPDGIDPEITRAVEQSPKLREALAHEVQQIEAAKQSYEQGLHANARASAAALFASYPELVGLTQEQLPGADVPARSR